MKGFNMGSTFEIDVLEIFQFLIDNATFLGVFFGS